MVPQPLGLAYREQPIGPLGLLARPVIPERGADEPMSTARAAALGDWRAGAWLLSHRWPERWGERVAPPGSHG
jgi:hypothetical protein